MNTLLVFIGGGLGCVTRFGVGNLFGKWFPNFPVGTLISNLVACFILAVVAHGMASKSSPDWMTYLIVIGFCGGFSTFSTFSNDNLKLIEAGNWMYAIANILISVIFGILIVYLVKEKIA